MPSNKRQVSKTGYYHIMSRGNNKADIYKTEKDYLKLLKYIKRVVDDTPMEVYAYCIMKNHPSVFGNAMHRINTAYSHYYMTKYSHVGHVFQGPFRSKTINDEDYLRQVIRYIHLNPVKANLTKYASEYRWSSYWEYIRRARREILPKDADDLLREYGFYDVLNFKKFHDSVIESDLDELYLDLEDKKDIVEEELAFALSLIEQAKLYSNQTIHSENDDSPKELLIKDSAVRMNIAMEILKNTRVLSCRRIAELTHVDRNKLKRV